MSEVPKIATPIVKNINNQTEHSSTEKRSLTWAIVVVERNRTPFFNQEASGFE